MTTFLKTIGLFKTNNSQAKQLGVVPQRLKKLLLATGLLANLLASNSALAASPPALATEPLSTLNASVKPNLMFVYDTSESMNKNFAANYLRENWGQCKNGYKYDYQGEPVSGLKRSGTTLTINTPWDVGGNAPVNGLIYLAVPGQPNFSGIYKIKTSNFNEGTWVCDSYGNVYHAGSADPYVAPYTAWECTSSHTNGYQAATQFTVDVANAGISGNFPASALVDARIVGQWEDNSCFFDSDPPNAATKVNGLYYDPTVNYLPPPKPNNPSLSLPSMSNTAQVRENGLAVDASGNQTSAYRSDIATTWPDVVYCDTPQRPAAFATDLAWVNSPRCARNTATAATLNAVANPAMSSYYPYQHPEKFRGTDSWFPAVDLYGNNGLYQQGQPAIHAPAADTFPPFVGKAPPITATTSLANVGKPFGHQWNYFAPFYYNIRPIEYCTNNQLTDCKLVSAGAPDTTYNVPSYVRYCKYNTDASNVTVAISGAFCQAANTGGLSWGADYIFPRFGLFERVDIVSTTASYPKAAGRTDCTGATCTYTEELTNFSNWYAYYRTRIQLMKSAAGRTFKDVTDSKRIGMLTLNQNDPDAAIKAQGIYLPISDFASGSATSQKTKWFTSLYNRVPAGDTPSIEALSRVGQIFAGKRPIAGFTTTADDPVQYSCQANFTLFTTDGYWTTPVANAGPKNVSNALITSTQDGGTTPKPMYDNSSVVGLADVARYYYINDLRQSAAPYANCIGGLGGVLDVCNNNVKTRAGDLLTTQHMTTFTLGLGIKGTMDSTGYKTLVAGGPTASADFNAITNGTKNWPTPVSNQPTAADDLWHAAVDSAATYFSAKNPTELINGLTEVLQSLDAGAGTASAAALSSETPVAGNNYVYYASYDPSYWSGNLTAKTIDLNNVTSTTPVWCVEDIVAPTPCVGKLKAQVTASSDTRTIYMSNGSALTNFDFANLTSTQKTYFDNTLPAKRPSQWAAYTAGQKTNAGGVSGGTLGGTNLVNYLRGRTEFDMTASVGNQLYRARNTTLGDIIDSDPTFVGVPRFDYAENDYTAFKTAQSTRDKMVYVGANDGMLHAFYADGVNAGKERWAFVPTAVMPNMWKLSDVNYKAMHTNFVNAKMTVEDVYNGSSWRTVLVSGLGQGGRAYFALDITNPASPSLLWEYSDANNSNLGYSYGKPVITKRQSDGKWLVLITSGYNNIPIAGVGTGNGVGHMFALNALNGVLETDFATTAGNTTTPSGLAQIAKYSFSPSINNVATYVYGGDLLGNVWRFNLNTGSAKLFATLNSGSNPQPMITEPATTDINGKRIVIIGTGKYIEPDDLLPINYTQQSLYVMKDDKSEAGLISPITRATMERMYLDTISGTPATRKPAGITVALPKGTNPTMDWSLKNGWYVDWPVSGERQYIKSYLESGSLFVPTIIPPTGVCDANGTGWINIFDLETGGAYAGNSDIVSTALTSPLTGLYVLRNPANRTIKVGGTLTKTPGVSDDNNLGGTGSTAANTTALGGIIPQFGGTSGSFTRGGWRELTE